MSYLSAVNNSPYSYMMSAGMAPNGTQGNMSPNGVSGIGNDMTGEKAGLPGIRKPSSECQTCKERKYQDGSDEMVSFKNPTHISPTQAGTAVRAHEQEHVRNAYSDAATKNGKVLAASVAIKTACCPECGRTYVAGGVTSTKIQYSDESNPYQKNKKALDHANIAGMNADYAV